MEERWNEIKQIWQEWKVLYVICGFILGVMTYPFIVLVKNDITELLTGLVPEAIGIGFTVFLIDRIYKIRDEQRETKELHRRLVREAGSRDNSTAVSAIDTMRNENLLSGETSLLKKANLYRANLSGANFGNNANLRDANLLGAELAGALLYHADLRGAVVRQAFLQGVYFREANLNGADFTFSIMNQSNMKEANLDNGQFAYASLQEAKIWGSTLRNCNLQGADLRGADLNPSDLRGANLESANLAHANITGSHFDESTIMPDGTYWNAQTALEKYTNPEHPDYRYYDRRDKILEDMSSI